MRFPPAGVPPASHSPLPGLAPRSQVLPAEGDAPPLEPSLLPLGRDPPSPHPPQAPALHCLHPRSGSCWQCPHHHAPCDPTAGPLSLMTVRHHSALPPPQGPRGSRDSLCRQEGLPGSGVGEKGQHRGLQPCLCCRNSASVPTAGERPEDCASRWEELQAVLEYEGEK